LTSNAVLPWWNPPVVAMKCDIDAAFLARRIISRLVCVWEMIWIVFEQLVLTSSLNASLSLFDQACGLLFAVQWLTSFAGWTIIERDHKHGWPCKFYI
jgi:hypothetical protein